MVVPWFEGVEESMDRRGQLLVDSIHLVSRVAGLSGLLPSRGTESLIEVLLGQPLAGLVGYTGQGSRLVRDVRAYPTLESPTLGATNTMSPGHMSTFAPWERSSGSASRCTKSRREAWQTRRRGPMSRSTRAWAVLE